MLASKRMKTMQFFLFILLCSYTQQATTVQQSVCLHWFVHDNRLSTGCSCYNAASVRCDSHFSSLEFGYCMTYDNATGATEYGPCPYIAHYNTITIPVDPHAYYIKLPSNVSYLNEFMCGPLNREGLLCGKCKDGYGTALYSYTLKCSKCWGHGYGWVLYYFLELFQ